MCELLIMTKEVSPHPTDDRVNAGQYRPGHVITIQQDGYQWDEAHIATHARVVKLPGVSIDSVNHLQSTLLPQVASNGNYVTHPQIRMWRAKDHQALAHAALEPHQISDWVSQNFAVVPHMPVKIPTR